MGIRETLNKNPSITTGVTAGIVALAIGAIVWQLWPSSGPMMSSSPGKQFFSDDDGATYFVDSSTNVPPFDHNGKQAVRAVVYRCGDNGKPFVGVLQRYNKEAKAKLEKANASKSPDIMMEDVEMGMEVKKPKTGDWVKSIDPKANAVNRVTCPDGKTDNLQVVMPE